MNDKYKEILEEAESTLRIKATTTADRYMVTLRTFDDFPTRSTIIAHTNEWLAAGQKGTTIRQKHAAIRWLMKHFPRCFDPVDVQESINYMSEIKTVEPDVSVATPEQAADVILKSDSRTALLVSLLFYHGLRVSDVTKLKVSDFAESGKGIVMGLRDKKTKQIHNYILVDKAENAFRRYVNGQRQDIINGWRNDQRGDSFLFLGVRGHLSVRSVQRLVSDACSKVGYPDLHCHSFRHGCGTAYAKAGASAATIKYALGHKSIASSMRYIHLDEDDLHKVAQNIF
ncbi:putative recombinase (plasmid) [Selenomonas ruminantium subsp. lactilytica TAM6421]|uniref:Putative recombinase n=2 Tax=Selenomonas ruminantium TaxID=971 RepID=I0GV65_SELRL|nr:putative recombinase [Selenomonas ruminantium subsp. lactilytica TAM6421]